MAETVEIIAQNIQKSKIGVLEFDCTLSETHNNTNRVTDHPIENGTLITDHVVRDPISLDLVGLVSNDPLITEEDFNKSPISTDIGEVTDRVEAAYAELERLWITGELITVVTSIREYPNMVVSSLSVSRDVTTGNVLNASISLRQIFFAVTETVDLPKPLKKANKKPTDKGKKTKTPADTKKTEKAQSVLSSLLGL